MKCHSSCHRHLVSLCNGTTSDFFQSFGKASSLQARSARCLNHCTTDPTTKPKDLCGRSIFPQSLPLLNWETGMHLDISSVRAIPSSSSGRTGTPLISFGVMMTGSSSSTASLTLVPQLKTPSKCCSHRLHLSSYW